MFEKTEGITLAQYQKAYRKIKTNQAKTGFLINLSAYVVVNALLVTINLLYIPWLIWCVFPLIGWGVGLAMHYTFGVRLLGRSLSKEEAKAERLAQN